MFLVDGDTRPEGTVGDVGWGETAAGMAKSITIGVRVKFNQGTYYVFLKVYQRKLADLLGIFLDSKDEALYC